MNKFKNIFSNRYYLLIGGGIFLLILVVIFFNSEDTFSTDMVFADAINFTVERIDLNDNDYNDNELVPYKIFQNYDSINKMIDSNCDIDGKTVCHLYKVSLEPGVNFDNIKFSLSNLTLDSKFDNSLWKYVLYMNDGTNYNPNKNTLFGSSSFEVPIESPIDIIDESLTQGNSKYVYLFIFFQYDPAVVGNVDVVSGSYIGEFKLTSLDETIVKEFGVE